MEENILPKPEEELPGPELEITAGTKPETPNQPASPASKSSTSTPLSIKLLIVLIIFFDLLLVAYIFLLAK